MPTKTMDGEDATLGDTFWLDGWEGKCKTGYYFRSDIGKKIEGMEKETGRRVVGIKLDREGWNIEFVLEAKDGDK